MFYCEECRDRIDFPRVVRSVADARCRFCGELKECYEAPANTMPPIPESERTQWAVVRLMKGEVRKVVQRGGRIRAEKAALKWCDIFGLDEAMCQTNLEANGRYVDAEGQIVVQIVKIDRD